MKIILASFLLFSVLVNGFLYMQKDDHVNQRNYHIADGKTKSAQLEFLNNFLSGGLCKINYDEFVAYLSENYIKFSERKEKDNVYLDVNYLTLRFGGDGILIDVVPDK